MSDIEREAFEKWSKNEFPHMRLERKGDTGDYLYKTAKYAYSAWQAARQAPAIGEVEPVAWKVDSSLFRHKRAAEVVAGQRGSIIEPVYAHPPANVPEEMRNRLAAWSLALTGWPKDTVAGRVKSQIDKLLTTPTPATTPQPAQQDMYRRLADKYRRDLFACQDELNNLRSEYHNRMAEMDGEIEELRSAQQGSVPYGFSEFVSAVRSINRSSHHQIRIPGDDEPCFWQRKEWIDWILELADQVEAPLSAAAPQPEGDGWIKCSERLPKHADRDVNNEVWVTDGKSVWVQRYASVERNDTHHWMPTGLKRPTPPQEQ